MAEDTDKDQEANEDELGKKSDTPQEADPKLYTQADLEAKINQRLDRVSKKFADYEALKSKAEKFDQIEAENLSAMEKLEKENAELKARAEQAEASRVASERKALIISEATKLNFADPTDAVALVGDNEDIPATLKKLAKDKPYLLKTGKPQPKLDPRSPGPKGRKETRDEQRARIYGLGASSQLFDPASAEQRGGGVVFFPGAKEQIEEEFDQSED